VSQQAKELVKDLPTRIGRIDNGMMRPFLPIVLLCAACGDNLLVDEEQGAPVNEPGFENVEPFFAPDVCSVRSWPSVTFGDRDVDVTVVPTPTGAAIFSVDRVGGPLRGFAIDGRGELETKEQGNIIRDDLTFTSVSAAFIDERLITAAVSAEGSVSIDMIRPDLGAHYNLSTARGTMVADVPMANVRDQRLSAIADTEGVTGIRFDTMWQTTGTQTLTAKAPRTITATRYREDTMVAWSTDSTCHLTRVGAEVMSSRNFPCLNGRIAVNPLERAGYMIYEEGADKLMISQIRIGGESEIANSQLFLENARSPKIVFDGSRYWVSYINARQDVVVGYLNTDGTLVSMALEGTQPMGEAYELAVINGGVWVFAVDGAGAGAQRLCLKPVR
jgi:hypothetical protein